MKESLLLVNLGCGPIQPDEWINVDYSNRAKLAKYLPKFDFLLTKFKLIEPTEFSTKTKVFDVRKKLPFNSDSIHAFYLGELLEHLTLQQAKNLINECYRALVPAGILRVNVPDNYQFWKSYCNRYEQIIARDQCEWDNTEIIKFIEMFFHDICISRPFFHSMGHFHKWAWDEVSLTLFLKRNGFINLKRCKLHESKIPLINMVEMRAYLVIEGVKPSNI